MLRPQQIVLGLALLLALCAESLALSQRPSPTERKAGQPEQQQSQAPKQAAATDQRGTEQSPLVVKVQPPHETETEAAAKREEREQRSANEQETIKFNRFLVIIGALQLVVFVGQLLVFSYQAWKLRQTVGAAENAAGAAKKSADSLRNIEP
jgi:cobalamin biosynthesis Mg chelatase CobN